MKNNINKELEFHDSLLVSINRSKDNYTLTFECVWDHGLNPAKQFIGTLDLNQVTKILNKDSEIESLSLIFEYGSVIDFELKDNYAELNVVWTKFNPIEEKYAFYKIFCDEVKWNPIRVHDPVEDAKRNKDSPS